MANAEIISGVDSYLLFGTESTFGTKASTITGQLALTQSINPTINRDAKEHRGFAGSSGSGQLPQKTTSGTVEVTFPVEFKPLEWTWMESVLGTVNAADGTAGTPFIYSFGANPSSLTFTHNLDNDTTDRNEVFLGSRFSNVTIRAALGEAVTVSADITTANFNKNTTLETNQTLITGEIFNFSGATLELPDSSAISHLIDSIEISINRTVTSKFGLGNYTAQNSRYGATELRVNVTFAYLDETFLDSVLGSSTTITELTNNATLTVRFDSSDTNKFAEFKFTNVKFPEWNETADLNEFITEGVTGWAQGLTVEETQAA